MTRVHVFGDTGGHAVQLFSALHGIGVDLENWRIPEDTVIVHLGDLIHRGPASNTIVSKVDLLMERNPGQWLQVLGNHEFQHLEDGVDFWRCSCSQDTAWTIERWYEEESARIGWIPSGLEPSPQVRRTLEAMVEGLQSRGVLTDALEDWLRLRARGW